MNTFEELRAFQRAVDLAVDVYIATRSFPREEMYGLTSQLRRASCSVASNIAEGQGRLTYGEWRQALGHARGSLYEVQAQIIIAERLEILPTATAEHLRKSVRATARELAGLLTWVTRRDAERKRRKTAT